MYAKLIFSALCLTFVVVVVGAYVRLQDAGLGCPDWPGCYGHLVGVPDQAHEVERAEQVFPGRTVEVHKAWKEMFHRYLAGTLGVLIVAILIMSWWQRRTYERPLLLPAVIAAVVALQAALGMWTVTLLLKPVIVTLHLLGGMTTLGLMTWLALQQVVFPRTVSGASRLQLWAILGLLILIAQIALGGWVSTNYAALACPDFPTCRGSWIPDTDFRHAFQFVRELGMTAAGTPLSIEALATIHWTHRIGALITFAYLTVFAGFLLRTPGLSLYAIVLVVLLVAQAGLGVANVLFGLPLAVAVAHNGVAASILVVLIVINFILSRTRRPV